MAEIARLPRRQARRAGGDRRRSLGELREQGYLDDARFARRFAEDRRRLDGWGAERIERRLLALGVDARARRAPRSAAGDATTSSRRRCALLRRRFPEPPATPRERDRALGMLVRKGYELELAHDAIRAATRGVAGVRLSRRRAGRDRAAIAHGLAGTTIRRSDRPGPHGPMKLQQISHFRAEPAASVVTATTTTSERHRAPSGRARHTDPTPHLAAI